jgi:two-component system response regulator AtoC
LIAASNRDLQAMMADGRFREDLFYRLKVVDLHIPPLRDRKEDIPEMVGLFICQNNPRMGLNISGITPRAMEVLKAHHWPGNIRELRNVVERAMLFCDDPLIDISQLPPDMMRKAGL